MMRKVAIILILALGAVFGQVSDISLRLPKEFLNEHHSATNANVRMHFHFDYQDTLNDSASLSVDGAIVYVSVDTGSTWIACTAAVIGTLGYDSTYHATYDSNPPSGQVLYYYKMWDDSSVTFWTPCNTEDSFPPPPNLLVHIMLDPANDADSVELPYSSGKNYYTCTDLRNYWVGYSTEKCYEKITVQGGGFPHSHSVTVTNPNSCPSWAPYRNISITIYHMYIFPIYNPNALYPDSIFYAAVKGNVNITFLGVGVHVYTGLYKITKPGPGASTSDYLSAYTRIGDIDTFVSGDTLVISFNWDSLTSDSAFGDLDSSDFVVLGCGIASFYIFNSDPSCWLPSIPDTYYYVLNDASKSAGMYLRSGCYTVAPSDSPSLNNYYASLTDSGTTFFCTYYDPNDDIPVIRQVIVGTDTFDMGSTDHSYQDSAQFVVATDSFTSGSTFYFRFSDGANVVTTDTLTLRVSENSERPDNFSIEVIPNPFNRSCKIINPTGCSLRILDISGHIVAKLSGEEITWQPQPDLPSGIYFIEAKHSGKTLIKRLVLLK